MGAEYVPRFKMVDIVLVSCVQEGLVRTRHRRDGETGRTIAHVKCICRARDFGEECLCTAESFFRKSVQERELQSADNSRQIHLHRAMFSASFGWSLYTLT